MMSNGGSFGRRAPCCSVLQLLKVSSANPLIRGHHTRVKLPFSHENYAVSNPHLDDKILLSSLFTVLSTWLNFRYFQL